MPPKRTVVLLHLGTSLDIHHKGQFRLAFLAKPQMEGSFALPMFDTERMTRTAAFLVALALSNERVAESMTQPGQKEGENWLPLRVLLGFPISYCGLYSTSCQVDPHLAPKRIAMASHSMFVLQKRQFLVLEDTKGRGLSIS